MPIEQKTTITEPGYSAVSAIDNEIPTYRAISREAVLSLICGVLAVLSFVHWFFLITAVLAIVLGIIADRKIQRLYDVLTGRGIAQAGVALGLSFGLASVTTVAVQDWITLREATKFARFYENVLNKSTLPLAFWYSYNPRVREGKTPEDFYAEMKKSAAGSQLLEFDSTPLQQLKRRISDDGSEIHFVKIERRGKEKLESYATALYELHPGPGKAVKPGEEFALLVLKGWIPNRKLEWFIEDVAFPYVPSSYKPAVKPADDGHGHAH